MATSTERQTLSFDEAVAMLPDGEHIHTFNSNGFALLGADWTRDEILELLKTGRPELAGGMATSMGHGLVAWPSDEAPLFIETRKDSTNV